MSGTNNKLLLLLGKNLVERRRNLVSTLSEILLPLCFIFLLVWLQHFDKDSTVLERDYTCPQQSAMSPTLLSSPELNQKASTRGDSFIFAVDTAGMGAGLQTIPPFLYVLALAAKTQSKIALVPADGESLKWFQTRFVQELDLATAPLEQDWRWQLLRKELEIFDIPFCRFGKLVEYYNSSKEVDAYVTSTDYGTGNWTLDKHHCPTHGVINPKLFAAIELRHHPTTDSFAYSLRMNFTAVPGTYEQIPFVDPLLVGVDPTFQDMYMLSGFLTLQLQMDRHLINQKLKPSEHAVKDFAVRSICDSISPMLRDLTKLFPDMNNKTIQKLDCVKTFAILAMGMNLSPLTVPASYTPHQVRLAQFPTPDYADRPFYAKTEDVMSLVLLLCYQWPTSRLIRGIVHEKESRLRESLLQMGVSLFEVMMSHLITYTMVFTTIAFLITWISSYHLFSASDPTVVFTFFALFGLSVVAFGFLVSVLFDRAKTASTAGVSLFFMAYLPYMALGTSQATLQAKSILSALFAPTGFGLGAMSLAHYEAGGQGVHWSNVWTAPAANDLPFATILVHQLYTCLLYLFMGWYFNQVVQSEFGVVRKPWYFLCMPKYWLNQPLHNTGLAAMESNQDVEHDAVDQSYFELPNEEMKQLTLEGRCLQTHKLRKEFPTPDGIKVAVQNLSATFYEGQICAFLGPNGGGKTSLIRMLTGDIRPTSGTALLNNRDLFDHMDELRQHLGVCPQHDVLFEDLTVGEHLALVARIKNVINVEEQITSSLERIGMPEKRHMLSSSLSGGQKRKLSLAMALIGDSKFVFLDEPTSGMDSHSRRFVWNLLMESKAGRIIVLTTHFLDEADYLGDQILIVGNGQLKCGGSSHFLKQRYGVGYTLTVMGNKEVGEVISKGIPEAKLLSAMGQESTFQVPFQSSINFPKVFKQFDQREIGYGVSVTTLEEVFVKVALEGDGNWAEAESARMQTRNVEEEMGGENCNKDVVHYATAWEQFTALFKKRAMYATRDRRSVCCNTLIPILLLVIGLGMLKLFPLPEPPLLQLNEHDAMQISNPEQVIQVVVDSPRLAEFIPQSSLFVRNQSLRFDNNCSQDSMANKYYDAKGIKAFSTFLREDQFHSDEPRPKLRFGAIHVDRDEENGLVSCTIFANSSAAHASAVYLNVLNQALLRSSQPNNPQASIQVASYPLRFTARFQQLLSTFSAISASISTIMAFSFIPASIAVYVVREREVSAKHQQLLAGTSLIAYWTSNFAFDAMMFCLPWTMALGLVHLFDIPALEDVAVVVLFGCYGLAIIPFTYLSSFYFHSHSTAQNVVLLLNFITGMVLTITSFVLSLIPATVEVNEWLAYVFRMFPGFCLGNGLFNLTVNESLKTFGDGVLIKAKSSLDWEVTGASIAFLLMESVVFFLLTLLVDFYSSDPFVRSKLQSLFAWKESTNTDNSNLQPLMLDEDVAKEMERIDLGDDEHDVVVCKHLRKVWPSTGQVAVQDATFGIQRGTVFGLLGVNGSGKTSTLKMLSGEVLPTLGTATINQLDILLEQTKVRRMIGYVPQFDALLDLLTVREHLELYGKLKGLRGLELETSVVQKMHDLRLEEFALRCAGTLSGGNKRKLSVAIALIGNPPLILADEPTTGVDALNRRFLCDTLSNYSKRFGAAVVLTTHSFEEIESLATRVGILYAGQFKMLGSIQHLKNRFGKGIVFRVRLEAPTTREVDEIVQRLSSQLGQRLDSIIALQHACNVLDSTHLAEEFTRLGSGWAILAELEREGQVQAKSLAHWFQAQMDADRFTKEFVLAKFPTATLASDQNHHNVGQQFAYRVEQLGDGITLGDCFAMFEQAKHEFKLQEYSISGTSLESIFISLAQHVGGEDKN
ncbi:hypothetical protein BASA81_007376 [Batrachochytrium salamandrivorans]|nr:hypothetical protein BASA81_007376 [Batrachochytrium salamandrivorans]